MSDIAGLEPGRVWRFFADFPGVPRPAKQAEAIRKHARVVVGGRGVGGRSGLGALVWGRCRLGSLGSVVGFTAWLLGGVRGLFNLFRLVSNILCGRRLYVF